MTQAELFSRMLAAPALRFADIDDFAAAVSQIADLPEWERALVASDLATLAEVAEDATLYDAEEAMARYHTLYDAVCDVLGLAEPPESLPFFIVDRFPEPFADRPWKAMCVDPALGTHGAVPCGIYYKPQYLCSGMFEIMVSHEIVHYLISHYSVGEARKYTSLAEEGVCEILAAYALLTVTPDAEHALCSHLLHNRAGAIGAHSIRRNYYNAANHIFDYVCQNGLSALLSALSQGRIAFGDADLSSIAYPSPQTGVLGKLQAMYSLAERMLVLPATAYLLFAESATVGECEATALAAKCNIPLDIVTKTLAKLQADGLLSVHQGVVYNYNRYLLPHLYYAFGKERQA